MQKFGGYFVKILFEALDHLPGIHIEGEEGAILEVLEDTDPEESLAQSRNIKQPGSSLSLMLPTLEAADGDVIKAAQVLHGHYPGHGLLIYVGDQGLEHLMLGNPGLDGGDKAVEGVTQTIILKA